MGILIFANASQYLLMIIVINYVVAWYSQTIL